MGKFVSDEEGLYTNERRANYFYLIRKYNLFMKMAFLSSVEL